MVQLSAEQGRAGYRHADGRVQPASATVVTGRRTPEALLHVRVGCSGPGGPHVGQVLFKALRQPVASQMSGVLQLPSIVSW